MPKQLAGERSANFAAKGESEISIRLGHAAAHMDMATAQYLADKLAKVAEAARQEQADRIEARRIRTDVA